VERFLLIHSLNRIFFVLTFVISVKWWWLGASWLEQSALASRL